MAALRTGVVVTIASTTTASTALPKGKHLLSPTVDCWIRQGASSVAATAGAGSTFLAKGALVAVDVHDDGDKYIAAIRASVDGTLSITAIEGE
jgi:hypothetical protein